jgi:hypothetical protein
MTDSQQYHKLVIPPDYIPTYGGLIRIPVNTILPTGHITIREIRIIDYYFMKILLIDLLKRTTCKYTGFIALALGLYSLYYQSTDIDILKHFYDPKLVTEQKGIILRESELDSFVNNFLREIFDNIADGYILPKMHAINTTDIMSPEIILFDHNKTCKVSPDSYQLISAEPLILTDLLYMMRPHYITVLINHKYIVDKLSYIKLHNPICNTITAEKGTICGRKVRDEIMTPHIFSVVSPSHHCYTLTINTL